MCSQNIHRYTHIKRTKHHPKHTNKSLTTTNKLQQKALIESLNRTKSKYTRRRTNSMLNSESSVTAPPWKYGQVHPPNYVASDLIALRTYMSLDVRLQRYVSSFAPSGIWNYAAMAMGFPSF